MFAVLEIPMTYLDVGSGTGVLVNTARKLDVEAYGIDLIPRLEWGDRFIQHNLCHPIDLGRKFNLVSSIEVAEHLPKEYVDIFVDTITNHVEKGGHIVFTAAPNGQGGDGHINLQPSEYWRHKFYDRGFEWNQLLTYKLALAWSVSFHALHHIEANLQIFSWR
jgi:cyclopropane fatty-acyl-phospholipid synthase-like methyltransferase